MPLALWQVCKCLISHKSSDAWASVPCEWNQGIGPCQAANTTQIRSPTAHQRGLALPRRRFERRDAIVGVGDGRFGSRWSIVASHLKAGGRQVAGLLPYSGSLLPQSASNRQRRPICLSLGSPISAVKESPARRLLPCSIKGCGGAAMLQVASRFKTLSRRLLPQYAGTCLRPAHARILPPIDRY